jgi:hypothetical protein
LEIVVILCGLQGFSTLILYKISKKVLDIIRNLVYNLPDETRKEQKKMIETRTYLTAARLIQMIQESAALAGRTLEEYEVYIQANWKNNGYEYEEQVQVRTGENYMTLNLLEADDLEYYDVENLRINDLEN